MNSKPSSGRLVALAWPHWACPDRRCAGAVHLPQLSAGSSHSCAVTSNGRILLGRQHGVWRARQRRYLAPAPMPVPVRGISNAVEVQLAFRTCARLGDGGGARCWGKAAMAPSRRAVSTTAQCR